VSVRILSIREAAKSFDSKNSLTFVVPAQDVFQNRDQDAQRIGH